MPLSSTGRPAARRTFRLVLTYAEIGTEIVRAMETVHQIPALIDRISKALETNPYLSRRPLRVVSKEGQVVVLEGHVESFFQKQIAQETIRRVDGVRRVENRLVVNWA